MFFVNILAAVSMPCFARRKVNVVHIFANFLLICLVFLAPQEVNSWTMVRGVVGLRVASERLSSRLMVASDKVGTLNSKREGLIEMVDDGSTLR